MKVLLVSLEKKISILPPMTVASVKSALHIGEKIVLGVLWKPFNHGEGNRFDSDTLCQRPTVVQ